MTGVSAGDTLTYSAPAGWFMTALGGPTAATNAAVANWTGQLEGPTNGMVGFQATPTMLLGASVGEQPAVNYSSNFTAAESMPSGPSRGRPSGSGILTAGSNGFPVSWTNPTRHLVQQSVYSPNTANGLDGMGDAEPGGAVDAPVRRPARQYGVGVGRVALRLLLRPA